MNKYPSQKTRVKLWVEPEYRDMLNDSAQRDGLTAKAAVEALIRLYHNGGIVIDAVKAAVKE